MDCKTFSDLGLFLGAEVELSVKLTSEFVR
jgi:hypothetical protein